MSTDAKATMGHHGTEYRVLVREGCTFIFGHLPIDHMAALTKSAGKRAVMDVRLARLGKANVAWGLPEDCKALAEKLATQALEAAPAASALERWLVAGERGASSNAIVAHLRGVPVCEFGAQGAHPHDPDDFQRCLKLLEDVPEIKADFMRMSEVCEVWARLTAHWPAITAQFMKEAGPDWRRSHWRAPKKYELMRAVIEGKV